MKSKTELMCKEIEEIINEARSKYTSRQSRLVAMSDEAAARDLNGKDYRDRVSLLSKEDRILQKTRYRKQQCGQLNSSCVKIENLFKCTSCGGKLSLWRKNGEGEFFICTKCKSENVFYYRNNEMTLKVRR